MAKEIKFDIEARDLLKKGVDELADAPAIGQTVLEVFAPFVPRPRNLFELQPGLAVADRQFAFGHIY